MTARLAGPPPLHRLRSSLIHWQTSIADMQSELSDRPVLQEALIQLQGVVTTVQQTVAQLLPSPLTQEQLDAPLTKDEISGLLALNKRLTLMTDVLREHGALAASCFATGKVPVGSLPTIDDACVEVRYELCKDDLHPEDFADNNMTNRLYSLETAAAEEPLFNDFDWAAEWVPDALRADPHCWLFRHLYDHENGPMHPHLTWRECLRVGKILFHIWANRTFVVDLTQDRPSAPAQAA